MASRSPLWFRCAFWALLLSASLANASSLVESSSPLYGNVDAPSISVFGEHATEDESEVVYKDAGGGEGVLLDRDLERIEGQHHSDILLAPSLSLNEIEGVLNAQVYQERPGDEKNGLKDLTEGGGIDIQRKSIFIPGKWNNRAEVEGKLNLKNDSITGVDGVMTEGNRGGASKAEQQQLNSLSNNLSSYKHILQEKVGNGSNTSERDSEAKKVDKDRDNHNSADSGEPGKKDNKSNADEMAKSGDPSVNQDNRTTSSSPSSDFTGKDTNDSQLDSSQANVSTNKPVDATSQQNNPISEDKPKEASGGKDETDPQQKPGEDVSKEEGNGNNVDKQPQNVCDTNHSCGDGKNTFSCLRTSGEGTQELSLLIQNKGDNDLQLSVTTPEFLRADPSDFPLERGASKMVPIYLVDFKAAKHAGSSKLNIKAGNYDCSIEMPTDYIKNLAQRKFFQAFPYPSLITPMVIVYLLLFIFVGVAAVWLWCRYGRKRQHGDSVKYQELEIGLSNQEKLGKMEEETLDGWDEVWDDGWEDTEAARSSSRPVQTLSSNGLAARRTNKDGWENNWDD